MYDIKRKKSADQITRKSKKASIFSPDLSVQGSIINQISYANNQLQLPSIQEIKKTGMPILQNIISMTPTNTYTKFTVDNDLDSKIKNLQGHMRLLEKKYRQNLKQGFENKIKAFRLQAVLQRKVLKQKLKESFQALELQQKIQKHKQAMVQHIQQRQFVQYLRNRNRQRSLKIRQRSKLQKQNVSLKKKQNYHKMQVFSKQMHDRVIKEHELLSKKKQYFDNVKRVLVKKDVDDQKKQVVDEIMQKSKVLDRAKQQLKQMYRIRQQRKGLSIKDQTFLIN